MLKYKGYTGQVQYDDEAKIFHGDVVGIKDVITFQGTTVEEIEQAFRDSVDDYLKWCKERKEVPEKPYSGKFNLRIPSDLHEKLARTANAEGVSLNAYIYEALKKTTKDSHRRRK